MLDEPNYGYFKVKQQISVSLRDTKLELVKFHKSHSLIIERIDDCDYSAATTVAKGYIYVCVHMCIYMCVCVRIYIHNA